MSRTDLYDDSILGQILLLQSTLHAAPDFGRLAEQVCYTMMSLPGIAAAALYIDGTIVGSKGSSEIQLSCEWPLSWDEVAGLDASTEAVEKSLKLISLQTRNSQQGCLVLALHDCLEDFQYLPFIENIANQIALLVENKQQEGALRSLNDTLVKQVEERTRALTESEARLRQIVDNMPVMMDALGKDNTIVAWNKECERVSGYSADEMIGNPASMRLLYPDDDYRERMIAELLELGLNFRDKEFELTCSNGEQKTISWANVSGKVTIPGWQTWAIGVDVTEKRQSQEKLEWELQLNRAQAEISKELLSQHYSIKNISEITLKYATALTGSQHGFVSSIDQDDLRVVGHTSTQMSGNQCTLGNGCFTFPIGSDGTYAGLWGHALNTGQSFFTNDPHTHPQSTGIPEGHIVLRNYLAVPVFIKEELAGLIALANTDRDFSDRDVQAIERLADVYALALHRYRFELERLTIEKRLRQAEKMESIGTLAGGIAHDFNNILSSIIGFTELALDEAGKDSSMEENLREVYSGSLRAKDLVKQILAFARKSGEEIKPVQPVAIAEEITHLLRSSIPSTIQIDQRFSSDSSIMGNSTQLHQIIMNLCTNAAHAMQDDGGTLSISIEDVDADQVPEDRYGKLRKGRYISLAVADTGTGIPPNVIHSIFDPYFTTKAAGEGTGMGLAMVQGIVESYGGQVRVDSRFGEGTTFTLYLPVSTQPQKDQKAQAVALPTGTERILIVDDEPQIAHMGKIMLSRLGYDVTTSSSSTDALELFKAGPEGFDLVITDMTMPDMTGDELARALMAVRPDVPVILCTGYSRDVTDSSVLASCIKAFMNKPFARSDLAATVRSVLDEQ